MENAENPKIPKKSLIIVAAVIAVVAVICIVGFGSSSSSGKAEILTTSTLKEIVDVEELSTYEATYNGIAIIYDEKKPEKVDYYVSYEAKVKAGLDFDDIKIETDQKTILVTLPTVRITGITVDEKTLDFIFYDKKANTSGVTATAYKACIADVKEESSQEEAILELAQQNAENTVKALLDPFVKDMGKGYTLEIRSAEEEA